MRSKLNYIALTIMTTIAIVGGMLNGDSTTRGLRSWPIEERRYFATLEDLKTAWAKREVPVQLQEGKVADKNYVVVVDSPYSGVNAIDVYCYINYNDTSWRLYTLTFLPGSNKTNLKTFQVDIKQRQDAIEIWREGAVFMTLDIAKSSQGSSSQP
jgi:hypothetical protein